MCPVRILSQLLAESQILCVSPCQSFVTLTTEEFADRFMSTIKSPDDHKGTNIHNLALLVMFSDYAAGCPSEEEWTAIMTEDGEYNW